MMRYTEGLLIGAAFAVVSVGFYFINSAVTRFPSDLRDAPASATPVTVKIQLPALRTEVVNDRVRVSGGIVKYMLAEPAKYTEMIGEPGKGIVVLYRSENGWAPRANGAKRQEMRETLFKLWSEKENPGTVKITEGDEPPSAEMQPINVAPPPVTNVPFNGTLTQLNNVNFDGSGFTGGADPVSLPYQQMNLNSRFSGLNYKPDLTHNTTILPPPSLFPPTDPKDLLYKPPPVGAWSGAVGAVIMSAGDAYLYTHLTGPKVGMDPHKYHLYVQTMAFDIPLFATNYFAVGGPAGTAVQGILKFTGINDLMFYPLREAMYRDGGIKTVNMLLDGSANWLHNPMAAILNGGSKYNIPGWLVVSCWAVGISAAMYIMLSPDAQKWLNQNLSLQGMGRGISNGAKWVGGLFK